MLLADSVGYLALAIMAVGLIRKNNKHLLLMIGLGLFLWALHYWLIGSTAGAVTHFIAGIGVFLAHASYHFSLKERLGLAFLFAALGVAGSLYTGITSANVLAALGGVIMTTSQYILRDTRMRQGFLIGEVAFFFFAFMVGSIPGMLVTVLNGLSGMAGLLRISKYRQRLAAVDPK